jgi:prepilin-type N-terminal cleavage/methylation domain-containing protein
MKGSRGFTLLEVILASSLLAILLALIFSAFSTGMTAYDTVYFISCAQERLHICMEEILGELMEANPQYIWVSSFNEEGFENAQELLVFLSARSEGGEFVVSNGQPQWQSVVVYLPYIYEGGASGSKKVLKRYERFGVPSGYLEGSFEFTYALNSQELVLPEGIRFDRKTDGRVVLFELEDFNIDAEYPLRVSIKSCAKTPDKDVYISLGCELSCRNKN